MNSLPGRIALHVLLPLVAGFFIYFVFRPDVVFVRWLTDRPPLLPYDTMNPALKLLVFSGPDLCWAYSLAAALYIWEAWRGNRGRFFPFLVTGILVLSEVLQVVLLPGFIFDVWDLVTVMIAAVLSTLFVRKKVVS